MRLFLRIAAVCLLLTACNEKTQHNEYDNNEPIKNTSSIKYPLCFTASNILGEFDSIVLIRKKNKSDLGNKSVFYGKDLSVHSTKLSNGITNSHVCLVDSITTDSTYDFYFYLPNRIEKFYLTELEGNSMPRTLSNGKKFYTSELTKSKINNTETFGDLFFEFK